MNSNDWYDTSLKQIERLGGKGRGAKELGTGRTERRGREGKMGQEWNMTREGKGITGRSKGDERTRRRDKEESGLAKGILSITISEEEEF
jgi:hypothetical protein